MTYLGPTLRRGKKGDHPLARTLVAVLLSLAVNAAVFLGLAAMGALVPPSARLEDVSVARLSSERWEANRAVRGERPQPRPRPPAPPPLRVVPPEPERPPGQVVEVAPSGDETRPPPESRFLSDRNNTVERETRSRHAAPGQPNVLPAPSAEGAKVAAGDRGPDARSAPGRVGPRASEGGEARRDRERLALAPGPGPGPAREAEQAPEGAGPPAPGDGEGGQRQRGRVDLSLSPEALGRIAGGPSPDHLEGVEEGDATFLNTRQWKYATYFNRIKQAVAASWDPARALDARDPDRSIYGGKDRLTLLAVTLDDRGAVKSLDVARTSGLDFLDRTAIEAFRRAEPFVNPPRGVVDGNGEIRFQFGFYLEMGPSPTLRLFRGPAAN
jgi:TonB family protein